MGQSSLSHNYENRVTLLDGRDTLIRPICSADYDALRLFFRRLGPETIFLRFNYVKPFLSEAELRSYCECDTDSVFALVAQMKHNGQAQIVGVGRYDRLADQRLAEVAFVVEDGEQGNGIGTHLLSHLAVVAKNKGLEKFVAETVNYNEIMLSIFRKFDPGLRKDIDGESCKVTFSITPSLRSRNREPSLS